jgi:hypothetical protein
METARITMTAHAEAFELGYDAEEVFDLISRLEPAEFEASLPSELGAGEWLDVYVTVDGDLAIYLKFGRDAAGYRLVSFHLTDV